MITITNKKIAGFEPWWAPYAGFSLLFDNPGASTTRSDDLVRIACSSRAGEALDLYLRLEQMVSELDRGLLFRTYLFCALPLASYHLTVWDGVNDGNLASVHAGIRSDWAAFLKGIPASLRVPPPSMAVITGSALANTRLGSINFRFDTLSIWGNQVLVARLCPADEASRARIDDLVAARRKLYEEAREKIGVAQRPDYSPHISLGYFANQEHGQLAQRRLETWTEQFGNRLAPSSITYSSLDIYAFTDMVSFFKLSRPTEMT